MPPKSSHKLTRKQRTSNHKQQVEEAKKVKASTIDAAIKKEIDAVISTEEGQLLQSPTRIKITKFEKFIFCKWWRPVGGLITFLLAIASVIISIVAMDQTESIKTLQKLLESNRPDIKINKHFLQLDSVNGRPMFVATLKNFGGRSAQNISMRLLLYNPESKYFEGTTGRDSINICPSGGELGTTAALTKGEWTINQLGSLIFASVITYTDPLTGDRYKEIFYAQSFKTVLGDWGARTINSDLIKTLNEYMDQLGIDYKPLKPND